VAQPAPGFAVARAAEFSQKVVDVCRGEEAMTAALASLVAHDGDTFAHVSNVCTYSIMLARASGLCDEDELLKVGQAALLHDIGKRSIQTNILKKPGRLTPAERAAIADHPRFGFEELCHRSDLTRDQLLTVYQHHEKLDGTGYPVGLVGDEINWMARLCAVVDVFDALTARRVYRRAADAEEALKVLRRGIGKHFSPEYVQCWTNLVDQALTARV
jgi:HD-GYP domain-containing protein (c-di-GMP phosphodiesterase class II)